MRGVKKLSQYGSFLVKSMLHYVERRSFNGSVQFVVCFCCILFVLYLFCVW